MTKEQRKEQARKRRKEWEIANKDHLRAYKKKWQSERIEEKRKSDRKRYLRLKEQIKQRTSKYYDNNKKQQIERCKAYRKNRMQHDENYRMRGRLSSRIRIAIKKQYAKKNTRTRDLLGCSVDSFRIYIESKFEPGMTWDNIHLDHIVPCALFDLTKPEHQKICFHFSNYQPLFARDNEKKGARLFHGEGHLPL